jgi:hypothetical protein
MTCSFFSVRSRYKSEKKKAYLTKIRTILYNMCEMFEKK